MGDDIQIESGRRRGNLRASQGNFCAGVTPVFRKWFRRAVVLAWLAAKELGGELRAHSDGPGMGATFTLELPCQQN
jgi:hypothetical protein